MSGYSWGFLSDLKKKELLFFVEKATRYTILLSSDMKDWVSLKKRIMGQGGYSSGNVPDIWWFWILKDCKGLIRYNFRYIWIAIKRIAQHIVEDSVVKGS